MSLFTPHPHRAVASVVAVCGLLTLDVPEAGAVPARASAGPSPYHILNLTPAGVTSSGAADINNLGQIVGRVEPELGVFRATTWVHGTATRLSELSSQASMINDRGQILGVVTDAAGQQRFVRWWRGGETVVDEVVSPGDEVIDLDQRGRALLASADRTTGDFSASIWDDGEITEVTGLPAAVPDDRAGWAFPELHDMNERGQVIGNAPTPFFGDGGLAFVWEDGVVSPLPSLDGGPVTTVIAINRRGQIAGNSSMLDGTGHPVIWHNGRAQDLGTLPGAAYTVAQSTKQSLSDNGHVVGFAISADFTISRAWIWHRGRMTDLGDLGGDFIQPYAVNDRGQVVGYGLTAEGELHAFFWERGRIADLGDLGGGESRAFDINDRGDIIGESRASDHQTHAVVWTTRRQL
jgi:probable HAF family extracellular repeat protein